jgi:hypothetical protein
MPDAAVGELAFTGLVLARELSGERFIKLTLVCPSQGLVLCLLRVSAKATAPDLFDVAEVTLEAPKTGGRGVRFASGYRVLRREVALGADYARLAAACRLALVVTRNPMAPDSAESVFALCVEAVGALATRPRPDAALFKTFWRLARDEGYPVREDWQAGLSAGERAAAEAVLRETLDAQATAPEAVVALTRSLERWLVGECNFVI